MAGSKFMGGREYVEISGQAALEEKPLARDVDAVISLGTLAIPSFSNQGGPFRKQRGRIHGGLPDKPKLRAALAALYCALMTDFCIEMLGARGEIILEGRFASNDAFTSSLAALRHPASVLCSQDESGTMRGATALWRLSRGEPVEPARFDLVAPNAMEQIKSVRQQWSMMLPKHD